MADITLVPASAEGGMIEQLKKEVQGVPGTTDQPVLSFYGLDTELFDVDVYVEDAAGASSPAATTRGLGLGVATDTAAPTTPAPGPSPGADYTDAQARAAQLNRTAAVGTTTITLTAESPADYGTAASGTFTVDATGCVVGKEAYFGIGAGGSAPVFTGAPAGQPYKFIGALYGAGLAFSYSLRVCLNRIEVVILAD